MDITMNVTESKGGEYEGTGYKGTESSPPPNPATSSAQGVAVPPKRIYRDPHGPVGGVAGGFAGYFDIDPVIARLLWIVALFSGIGIPAYVVCWLIIPKAKVWPPPGYDRPAASSLGQNNTALLSGLVIIGLVAVIGAGVDGIGEYLLPAALVGFGVYLLGQRGSPGAAPVANAIPAEDDLPDGTSSSQATWAAPDEAIPAERAGLVTPTVLSVLAIAAGVMGALHAAGLIHMSISTAAAGGLVIVGAGLLASLWLGRARGLVPLGLGLAVIMLAAATVEPWFAGEQPSPRQRAMTYLKGLTPPSDRTGSKDSNSSSVAMGDRHFAPESLAELETHYEVGMGSLTIDVSRIDFSEQTRALDVELGMGDLTIVVPAGTKVRVDGEVGAGEAITFGHSDDGLGFEVDYDDPGAGAGTLEIDYQLGMGRVEVRRVSL
jgi:phage shock protein PspC (stress-responsive transcriptional regulator)